MIDPKTIAFAINGKSHRVRRHGSWLDRAAQTRSVHSTFFIEDFATLQDQIEHLAQDGVTTFFVDGGDGTVSGILSACDALATTFASPPQFAILPGGSTNLAHKALGFKATRFAAFQQKLDGLIDGATAKTARQSALRITCAAWPIPEVGFLVSTGTVARAMRYVQREFHGTGRRGSTAVAMALVRFLVSPETYMDRDGKPVLRGSAGVFQTPNLHLEGQHGFSIMTSLPRLSLGLNPFWGTGPGGLALTHANWPMPRFRSTLLNALTWKRRSGLHKGGLSSYRMDRLALKVDDPIMVDGELREITPQDNITITLTDPIGFLR
ncbi:MAG: diacylglycerol kinase family protein [Pseudomonadota bacterium]